MTEKLARHASELFDALRCIFKRAQFEKYEGNRYVESLSTFWSSAVLIRKADVEDKMIELVLWSKDHP